MHPRTRNLEQRQRKWHSPLQLAGLVTTQRWLQSHQTAGLLELDPQGLEGQLPDHSAGAPGVKTNAVGDHESISYPLILLVILFRVTWNKATQLLGMIIVLRSSWFCLSFTFTKSWLTSSRCRTSNLTGQAAGFLQRLGQTFRDVLVGPTQLGCVTRFIINLHSSRSAICREFFEIPTTDRLWQWNMGLLASWPIAIVFSFKIVCRLEPEAETWRGATASEEFSLASEGGAESFAAAGLEQLLRLALQLQRPEVWLFGCGQEPVPSCAIYQPHRVSTKTRAFHGPEKNVFECIWHRNKSSWIINKRNRIPVRRTALLRASSFLLRRPWKFCWASCALHGCCLAMENTEVLSDALRTVSQLGGSKLFYGSMCFPTIIYTLVILLTTLLSTSDDSLCLCWNPTDQLHPPNLAMSDSQVFHEAESDMVLVRSSGNGRWEK